MSAKYQKPLTIPDGFPALLKGFTREVLRAQPENIYEFGAQYFGQLAKQQKDAGPSSSTRTEDQQQDSQGRQQYTSIQSREQYDDVHDTQEQLRQPQQEQEVSYATEGSQYDEADGQQQEDDY